MSKWLKQLYNYCTTNKTASASVVSRQDKDNDKFKTAKNTKPVGEN